MNIDCRDDESEIIGLCSFIYSQICFHDGFTVYRSVMLYCANVIIREGKQNKSVFNIPTKTVIPFGMSVIESFFNWQL